MGPSPVLLTLAVVLPLWGAEDPTEIIKRLVAAEQKNGQASLQYTYVQETERYRFAKDGQPRLASSEKHDVIFVEGLRYEKLVARNGRPLSPKERQRVDQAMSQTAEQRRRTRKPVSAGGQVRVNGFLSHKTTDLGSLSELLVFFNNRIAGEDEIRGHKVWVIECEPEKLEGEAKDHEKQVRSLRKKIWVDQKDGMLVRAVYTFIERGAALGPGSSITLDFDKVDAEVWEPVSMVLEASDSKEKVFRPAERVVFKMGHFKKFDVQSTITLGGR